MERFVVAILFFASSAFGWQKVCTFTFKKSYDGVRVEKVKVYKEKAEDGLWTYGVGVSGVKVSGHSCRKNERLTAYVGARVKSSGVGFLDTGDIKARGKKGRTYWKLFDGVNLRNCQGGVEIWTSWACEKALSVED